MANEAKTLANWAEELSLDKEKLQEAEKAAKATQ